MGTYPCKNYGNRTSAGGMRARDTRLVEMGAFSVKNGTRCIFATFPSSFHTLNLEAFFCMGQCCVQCSVFTSDQTRLACRLARRRRQSSCSTKSSCPPSPRTQEDPVWRCSTCDRCCCCSLRCNCCCNCAPPPHCTLSRLKMLRRTPRLAQTRLYCAPLTARAASCSLTAACSLPQPSCPAAASWRST